jgi:hypothetical protein
MENELRQYQDQLATQALQSCCYRYDIPLSVFEQLVKIYHRYGIWAALEATETVALSRERLLAEIKLDATVKGAE